MDFRILGPLEVLDDGRTLDLGGARQRALLAIMLLRRGELVTPERLIEELYAGAPPPTAAKSLQAHVSRLRRALGANGRLRTRPGGYVLELGDDELDADRFADLLERGRRALQQDEHQDAAEMLAAALGLWRGAPLADLSYESFAQTEIDRLEELRLGCLEERLEADLALGRHAEVIGELEQAVAEQPLRERLRSQLMLALYRCGRQADALDVYHEGRRALSDALGLDPARSLQDLERAILNQDPALDVAPGRAAGTDPVQRGRQAAGLFVGRERELSLLEAALADARGGHGRLVLLSGEAGIGKSRLADEVASRAKGHGVRVLWGRCWEAGGAPAYWPWVQALRTYLRDADADGLRDRLGRGAPDIAHLLPELRDLYPDLAAPPALDTEGARFRVFDSTAAFLRNVASEQPLMIVLDDVHAADVASLLMLEFVAAELADTAILVVAAYRDPELDPGDPIAAALSGLARLATGRLSLTGLREPEVASYIESSSHMEPHESLVAAIAAETEGNPLFVGEIVRMLAAEGRLSERAEPSWRLAIPETVKEVIGRRLHRLSPECREQLALASVVGREFGLDLLERLSDCTAGELLRLLDEAIGARLVTDVPGAPGRMRFTHALVRDTLYDALPHGRRLDLHRCTGESIEALAGADPRRLSELAHHFFHALPAVGPDVAVAHARRAAEQASLLLAHEEAGRLYENALRASELCSPPDRELERALLLALGEAHARSGDTPRAKDAFLRAAALARAAGADDDLAAAALGYGSRIAWARPAGDRLVLALLEEALAAVGEEETPLRARLLARLAGCLRDERDPTRRVAVGELAVATARRVGDDGVLSFALAGLAAAQHGISDYPRRLMVTAELLEASRAAGRKEEECEALMAETLVYFESNEVGAVRDRAARIEAIADDLRQASQRWFAAALKAMLALHEGRLSEADGLSVRALEIGERSEGVRAVGPYAVQLFILRREQGRAADALQPLTAVVAETPARPFFRTVLGALHVELGQLSQARLLFEELAANGFEIVPRDNEWLLAAHYLAETCCALGDTVRATILFDELEPLAARAAANVPEGSVGTLARSVAGLAELLDRSDDAVRLLEQAIELDRASGARPWAAHAEVELARIVGRAGDHARAASLRANADATAAELGMAALRARIADEQAAGA